jgi:hypothetical protein
MPFEGQSQGQACLEALILELAQPGSHSESLQQVRLDEQPSTRPEEQPQLHLQPETLLKDQARRLQLAPVQSLQQAQTHEPARFQAPVRATVQVRLQVLLLVGVQ